MRKERSGMALGCGRWCEERASVQELARLAKVHIIIYNTCDGDKDGDPVHRHARVQAAQEVGV